MDSLITKEKNEEASSDYIDLLSSAFRTQTTLTDNSRTSASPLSTRPTPTLRKRSSSNLFRSNSETNKDKRRDSNGINYSNFLLALNKDDEEEPLFTIVKNDEPSSPSSKTSNRNSSGRIKKRLSATINSPIFNNPHGNLSNSSITKTNTHPIEPFDLSDILNDKHSPLLIDMRPLELYEKSRIRSSIHMNVPTLLIKRYRRGVVSNFNLESFISTPQELKIFHDWLAQFQAPDIQNVPEQAQVILYDDNMQDTSAPVWVLMGVIRRNSEANVHWLKSGFQGFQKWDFSNAYIDGERSSPLSSSDKMIPLQIPTVSKSATTFRAPVKEGPRRASLFNLDTTNIKAPSLSNRKIKKRLDDIFSPTVEEEQFHTPQEVLPPPIPSVSFTSTTSSEDSREMVTAVMDLTPKTENEYDFIVSEIVPNFLYLGPEIVNAEQLIGLKSRKIKRILNMAEECDDDVPGLKNSFAYRKIAARDTVEMQNVQDTLKKAVQVISKAIQNIVMLKN